MCAKGHSHHPPGRTLIRYLEKQTPYWTSSPTRNPKHEIQALALTHSTEESFFYYHKDPAF